MKRRATGALSGDVDRFVDVVDAVGSLLVLVDAPADCDRPASLA